MNGKRRDLHDSGRLVFADVCFERRLHRRDDLRALLLVLIRRAVAARLVLLGSAGIVLALTIIFGVVKPLFAGAWLSLSGLPFTLLAGVLLSAGLFAVARFASARVATFVVSLLAVQCVLNALLDLKTVFFLSSPFAATGAHRTPVNMANATGVPADHLGRSCGSHFRS